MEKVIVTHYGTPGELLALEPTIEALWYEHYPCEIKLYTLPEHKDFLSQNPYIKEVGNLEFDIETEGNATLYSFEDTRHNDSLSFTENYAAHAQVKLLRKEPSFGSYADIIYKAPRVVVQTEEFFDFSTNEELLKRGALFINPGEALKHKDAIRSCDTFIGSDGCGLSIAYASGVRNIVAIDPTGLQSYPGIQFCKAGDSANINNQINIALNSVKYPAYCNVGNAREWIQNKALRWCKGKGLDVGSNQWPLPGALPSDINSRKFDQGPFDFIFSSHCLEHIENWQDELKLWEASIKPGGIAFLYLPHPAMEPWRPGGEWVGPWHLWSPEPVLLTKWITENTSLKIQEYSVYPDSCWSFYIIAQKAF